VWDQRRSVQPLNLLLPSHKKTIRIHHFVPGIALAFISGAVATVLPSRGASPWLAVPLGAGVAMTLDEAPRLFGQDLYWSRERVAFAQGYIGLAGALGCGARILRRAGQTTPSATARPDRQNHQPGGEDG
jgi:hypothetical protein